MDENIHKVIDLINQTDLDQTIKDILIRDLKNEGLTDYMREQIKAYCLQEIKELTSSLEEVKKILDQSPKPSA